MALLLPELGSNWSASVIVAVLVCGLGLVTVARIRSVCGDPTATVPTLHSPVVESYVPWLGMSDTNDRPDGSRSVTWASVAASGPLLLSVTVKVTVSPTLGVGLLTVLESARSACCGTMTTLALLSVVSGSNWSLSRMSAVLIRGIGLSTLARIFRVCGVAVVTVPTFQTPGKGVYVPWLGVSNRKVSPEGSTSCTST